MPLMTPPANVVSLANYTVAPSEPLVIDTTPPGEALNSAFVKINENFANVWAAGPVASNIQIGNNSINTVNTNGNLVLNPNGIGAVIANAHVIPDTANIRDLGTNSLRWRELYLQYANISGNLDIAGSFNIAGDLSIGGNLAVTGNIIEVGNIITDSLTIQLANTAVTANAANGAGITVGANDNIATLLYNSSANSWTTNITVASPQLLAINGVVFNSRTINSSFTLNGYNGESVGPIDIGAGVVIDIISGDWVIL